MAFAVRESAALEAAALLASPVWLGVGAQPGRDRPVVLVPGAASVDLMLSPLSTWLRLRGYRPRAAGLGLNVGCSEAAAGRLEQRVAQVAHAAGERVSIVGHSRGGLLAKAVAGSRPDLVAGIVTLGTCAHRPPATRRAIDHVAAAWVTSGHLPNPLSPRCASGRCGRRFAEAFTRPFPQDVGYMSVYSRADVVAPWRACRHPAATLVEVGSTHRGLTLDPDVYVAIGRGLSAFPT